MPLTSRTGVSRVAEERRLDQSRRRVKHWNRWGPYLADRAWGTVREDYSRGPTHPHASFPYDELVTENERRSADDPEYELLDTGVFDALQKYHHYYGDGLKVEC